LKILQGLLILGEDARSLEKGKGVWMNRNDLGLGGS